MAARYVQQFISLNPGVDSSTTLNTLKWILPYPLVIDNTMEISLTSFFMFYSWFNISAFYNNNFLSYRWIDNIVYPINIPDSQLSASDLGLFIQYVMGQNGHYIQQTVSGATTYMYFISLVVNTVYYRNTLTCTPVVCPTGWTQATPTISPWTAPVGPFGSTLGYVPQLIIPSITTGSITSMSSLIGYLPGSYPPTFSQALIPYMINGTLIPNISPVSAVNISLNLVANSAFNPNPQTIYSFSPNVTFGSQIQINPAEFVWLSCNQGNYSEILLQLYDQLGAPLQNVDSDIIANFVIRKYIG
jgi:hypothetical protein